MNCVYVFFLAAIFLCGTARAEGQFGVGGWYLPQALTEERLGITPELSKCLATLEGGTTAGRRYCLGDENRRQDARLNRAYREGMKKLRSARQELLRRSQRAWIQFAASQCELEAGPPTGGTDWGDELAICDIHWRAYRAMFLESLEE